MNFAPEKFCQGAGAPENVYVYIYNVPAQEMTKHHAKFGWPPVSDVAAVTRKDAKTTEMCWGAPNSRTDLSH